MKILKILNPSIINKNLKFKTQKSPSFNDPMFEIYRKDESL
jgi:hypothetical protein